MRFWQYNLLGLLLAGISLPAAAVSVSASTDWSNCQASDSITDAGDYYTGSLESGSALLSCTDAYLTISGTATSTTAWTLSARLVSSATGLGLELKRTGNGTGSSAPSGGTDYTTLSTAYETLFTGQGNVSSIPLQFRVNNLDVSDGNGTKNIQIQYQITTQ